MKKIFHHQNYSFIHVKANVKLYILELSLNSRAKLKYKIAFLRDIIAKNFSNLMGLANTLINETSQRNNQKQSVIKITYLIAQELGMLPQSAHIVLIIR